MQLPIKNKASAVSYIGIFTAALAVLSFFEGRMGVNFGIPGVKFGLSNIVIISALMLFGSKAALLLAFLKIIFSFVFTSGISGFLFTAFGTAASFTVMCIAKKVLDKKVSAVGISVLGGTAHITMQYLCSALVLGTSAVWGLYPAAAAMSVVTSAVVGIICNLILERKYIKWD